MKVILLKDVPKIGKKFETKEVSDGHALNFLIPRGLATPTTGVGAKKAMTEKALLDTKRASNEAELSKNLATIGAMKLTIKAKANPKGHLFSAIHGTEIAQEILKTSGISIDSEFIILPKPLKEIGEHTIEVSAGGKNAKLSLTIVAL